MLLKVVGELRLTIPPHHQFEDVRSNPWDDRSVVSMSRDACVQMVRIDGEAADQILNGRIVCRPDIAERESEAVIMVTVS